MASSSNHQNSSLVLDHEIRNWVLLPLTVSVLLLLLLAAVRERVLRRRGFEIDDAVERRDDGRTGRTSRAATKVPS